MLAVVVGWLLAVIVISLIAVGGPNAALIALVAVGLIAARATIFRSR